MRKKQSTVLRLLRYLSGGYKLPLLAVACCIIISALASVGSSLFLETLIDGYVTPLLLEAAPVFSGLLRALVGMAVLYLAGVLATFVYNRIMVVIAQGVMKTIRDNLFSHM